jgi:hypothetical protein
VKKDCYLLKERKSTETNCTGLTLQIHCTGKFRIQEHEGIEIDIRRTNRVRRKESMEIDGEFSTLREAQCDWRLPDLLNSNTDNLSLAGIYHAQ